MANLRQTFVEWAAQTINKSFWAGAYYQQQRDKGCSYNAAVALAFKWIRILYRCWQTRTPSIYLNTEAAWLASLESTLEIAWQGVMRMEISSIPWLAAPAPPGQPAFACKACPDLLPCCGAGVPSRRRSGSAYPGTVYPPASQSVAYSVDSSPTSQGVLHARHHTLGSGHASVRTPDRCATRRPTDPVPAGSFCRNVPDSGDHSESR